MKIVGLVHTKLFLVTFGLVYRLNLNHLNWLGEKYSLQKQKFHTNNKNRTPLATKALKLLNIQNFSLIGHFVS